MKITKVPKMSCPSRPHLTIKPSHAHHSDRPTFTSIVSSTINLTSPLSSPYQPASAGELGQSLRMEQRSQVQVLNVSISPKSKLPLAQNFHFILSHPFPAPPTPRLSPAPALLQYPLLSLLSLIMFFSLSCCLANNPPPFLPFLPFKFPAFF